MSTTLSRRSFLQQLRPSSGGKSPLSGRNSPLSSDLTPFTPDANNPWDEIRAGHLLRRTMMGPTWADTEALVKLGGPGPAVDLLLGATSTPAAPSAANTAREDPNSVSDQTVQATDISILTTDAAALRAWWATLQQSATLSIQEKMVYFWSGHFTSAFALGSDTFVTAQLLYRQNQTFRGNALGSFQDLVKGVTLDGAMLVYLGGNLNVAGAPNENYARELMELFTCGISGGYTQADVEAGARILTGWQVPQYTQVPAPNGIFSSYFQPGSHDTGDKKYFLQDFPSIDAANNTQFLVQQNEIDKMIDVLFQETGSAIATFISTKLYEFFVYSDPGSVDPGVVSAMATLLIQSNWEIKPVVSALLKSEHFFDNINIGCQIKTPAEYDIGIARQIVQTDMLASFNIDANMTNAGQQFFQPPNVSGWPGYHDWITTNSYPIRGTQAATTISGMSDNDALSFVKQFASYNTDVEALSTSIGQLLLPRPLSSARLQTFWQMLAGSPEQYDWVNLLNSNTAQTAINIRNLLNYIIALPDFELC